VDKSGNIKGHSELKLSIYKKYLEIYLSIMREGKFFKCIFIVEPFAGKGIDNNGKEGSALIAKRVISSLKDGYEEKKKSVFLRLNEKEKNFYDKLKKNLESLPLDIPDISVSNDDANKFIVDTLKETKGKQNHRFFFIDPWGYTQLKGKTYQEIFKAENLDLLIFIPIHSIYRFLRKEKNSNQLKPIADFLRDIGIDEKDAEGFSELIDFIEEIKCAFYKKVGSKYVYYKILKNEKINDKHTLFFISKHILGAEKFLEVLDKFEEKDLFKFAVSDLEGPFIEDIRDNRELTNCELYKCGILNGLLPKRVKIVLEKLETDKKITVVPEDSCKKHIRRYFYIGYKYYKEESPKLKVIFNKIN